MSIAAYPLQTALPSYSEFELQGGQNNGSCFVLRGQSGGQPTILRPRVTPIQEASMSVAINVTINTLSNNATDNGYEGIAPTVELLKVTTNGLQSIWNNGLFGQQRRDLWIASKQDWHKLTWIIVIPQLGADLLNIGLVNKSPSGYAKVGNLSLTNHYSRYFESSIFGDSGTVGLTYTNDAWPTWAGPFFPFMPRSVRTMDTITLSILRGEDVTMTASGELGCVSDSDSDVPIVLGIAVKFRSRQGQYIYKTVATLHSATAVIDQAEFVQTIQYRAEDQFTQAEILIYMTTEFGRQHSTSVTYSRLRVEIASKANLTSTAI